MVIEDMNKGGLTIKYKEGNFMIHFLNEEEEDYKTMELLISFSLKERHNSVIKRLLDLMLVVLSEIAINDSFFYRRMEKAIESIKEARMRNGNR